jgi:MOSC domain-containing protein YiiM
MKNGDTVETLFKARDSLSVVELMRLYSGADRDPERLKRAMALTSIPREWHARLERSLQPQDTASS